jgi:hypothetical protein
MRKLNGENTVRQIHYNCGAPFILGEEELQSKGG